MGGLHGLAENTLIEPMRRGFFPRICVHISPAMCDTAQTKGTPGKSALLAQHYQQIQRIRLGNPQHRENRVSLPSMVGLVIEEMSEPLPTALPLGRAIQSAVVPRFLEGRLRQAVDESDDPSVFVESRGAQRWQILEQYGIELIRFLSHPGQTPHPNSTRGEQVIQRAVKTLEICAGLPAIQPVIQRAGHPKQSRIGPGVVLRQHYEMCLHRESSLSVPCCVFPENNSPLNLGGTGRRQPFEPCFPQRERHPSCKKYKPAPGE